MVEVCDYALFSLTAFEALYFIIIAWLIMFIFKISDTRISTLIISGMMFLFIILTGLIYAMFNTILC